MNIKMSIGKIVKVKVSLKPGKYGSNSFMPEMEGFRGKLFRISDNSKWDGWGYKLVGNEWDWTPEMLELPTNEEICDFITTEGSKNA